MLCSKLHCQKRFNLIPFSYKILQEEGLVSNLTRAGCSGTAIQYTCRTGTNVWTRPVLSQDAPPDVTF